MPPIGRVDLGAMGRRWNAPSGNLSEHRPHVTSGSGMRFLYSQDQRLSRPIQSFCIDPVVEQFADCCQKPKPAQPLIRRHLCPPDFQANEPIDIDNLDILDERVVNGAGRPVEQTLGHIEGDVQFGHWAIIVDQTASYADTTHVHNQCPHISRESRVRCRTELRTFRTWRLRGAARIRLLSR